MELIKQVIAIDVAKDELVCTIGFIYQNLEEQLKSTEVTSNDDAGFKKLECWLKKYIIKDKLLEFVFEATGVYHEKLAVWLSSKMYNVVIVLPSKIANYAKTLNLKTITDKTSSEVICRFGLRHKLDYWQPGLPIYKKLKQLTRERSQILDERTIILNQIHAEKSESDPNASSLERMEARLILLTKQELEVKKEIEKVVESDAILEDRIKLITTIPGVGLITAATIIGETNGFELIRNKSQLVSYAGLDVVEKQSGTSIKKKSRISKKGNIFLRKALHFPAIVSVKYNDNHKEIHTRIVSKSGIKMKGYVVRSHEIA